MKKLLNAKNNLSKNSKKGFTLIELIVVIVILAILIAALAPAILNAIERANIVADEAEARTIIMAASVGGLAGTTPKKVANLDAVKAEISGTPPTGTGTIYFNGVMAVGMQYNNKAKYDVFVGDTTSTDTMDYS